MTFLALLKNWRMILGAAGVVLVVGAYFYVTHLQHVIAARNTQIDGKNKALNKAAEALRVASQAIGDRDAQIIASAAHEASDATQTATFWKGQSRAAFDAGYASHRCPGEPVGVRGDLRSIWQAGAFNPASAQAVPGKPDGQD